MTLLLSSSNPESLQTVLQLAYDELHGIAVRHFRNEPAGRTLQPTDILHEACLRFIRSGPVFKNRKLFFSAASKYMRRVLVESARRRGATKREGHRLRVDFSEAERIGFEQPKELLDFDLALGRLEAFNPRLSEVAQLRVFGGMSTPEAARVLGIGASTARRRWAQARVWLRHALKRKPGY
jgi:RNA polymerase sigma factor (TIGR02999 family)